MKAGNKRLARSRPSALYQLSNKRIGHAIIAIDAAAVVVGIFGHIVGAIARRIDEACSLATSTT